MRYIEMCIEFTDTDNLYEGYLDDHGYSYIDVELSSIFGKINKWNINVTGKFNTEKIHLVRSTQTDRYCLYFKTEGLGC